MLPKRTIRIQLVEMMALVQLSQFPRVFYTIVQYMGEHITLSGERPSIGTNVAQELAYWS